MREIQLLSSLSAVQVRDPLPDAANVKGVESREQTTREGLPLANRASISLSRVQSQSPLVSRE